MIGGNLKQREKVRKIFTQVVNSLTSKMEIGGPMASLYILGNPDHYTDHRFVPFYWRGYFIGLSKVNDYVYRPSTYDKVSLYDWIRFSEKTKKRRTIKKAVVAEHDTSVPPLADFIEDDIGYFNDVDADVDDEEEDDELDVMDELAEHVPKTDHSFRPGHPQHNTHKAHMRREDSSIVPNFLPNTLPRSDCGDREYYCCTMLTFFKPWRSGKDLKSSEESWDKAFVAHEFNERQMEIMKYFNLRYECLDARDDYSAKRDK
ncbi:hypothetical protein PILCRDRAFT_81835, partial [Piloderma croceum F 1598]